jgi:hypothetical protein
VSECLDQVGKSLGPAPTRFKQNAVSGVAPRPLTNHQGATIRSAPEPFPAHHLLLFEGPESVLGSFVLGGIAYTYTHRPSALIDAASHLFNGRQLPADL